MALLGIRHRANIILDLFWKPFDVRFSKVLARLTAHGQNFEKGLEEVYSEETLLHYTKMDKEIEANATQRQDLLAEKERVDRETRCICACIG